MEIKSSSNQIIYNGFRIVDYKENLCTTVNFRKNKNKAIHRWYPFVEGFSEDFIKNILLEIDFDKIKCLELFSGSGTTPLVLQGQKIECYSFEISPFMYLLSKVKLRTDYSSEGYEKSFNILLEGINFSHSLEIPPIEPPNMKSMVENESREKWLFNSEVMNGILDIKYGISQVNDKKYKDLYKVALASILLETSNVYRNGKCLSYKKNWESKNINREDVHKIFINKLKDTLEEDIKSLQKTKTKKGKQFSNYKRCYNGDVRKEIDVIKDESINLVITSPPYLNSRDYTDTYMIELWVLDLITGYENIRQLRRNTIRSHVQVKWKSEDILNVEPLTYAYREILKFKEKFWNISIPDMIIGYFNDMNIILNKLKRKMVVGGKIYFNVANSAYYGVNIETDIIIAEIAERNGFSINEIRVARHIAPSSQQKNEIDYLRESVIVMTKN